ncbi:hypothetical protein JZ751_004395 [Albula glossodonta]|uniref:Redox-regulatory protein FAM213A n=1 Tax=Albula glossodonta TaxID=121402 RepID=A0A8T2N8A6_9TELE|nr:hypothetical protein JZ751_004395 [Albula glossodonta]
MGTLAVLTKGLGVVGGFIAKLLYAFTDLFLTKPMQAGLDYLEDTDLKTMGQEVKTFKAKTLWEKSGAVILAVRRPG